LVERLRQLGVAREVRQHAELDLRVVRGDEDAVVVASAERPPYLAAGSGADGDVLDAGVGGREPAGGRPGLMERGVQPARRRAEVAGQGQQVSAKQLVELPVLEKQR